MDGITPNSRTSCKKLVEQGVEPGLAEVLANWQQEELTNWAASGQAKNDMEHRAVLEKLDEIRDKLAEERTRNLASREDLEAIRSDLTDKINTVGSDLTGEINSLRKDLMSEICSVRKDLAAEIKGVTDRNCATEMRLLKWQIGIGVFIVLTLGGAIARGFGWLGF